MREKQTKLNTTSLSKTESRIISKDTIRKYTGSRAGGTVCKKTAGRRNRKQKSKAKHKNLYEFFQFFLRFWWSAFKKKNLFQNRKKNGQNLYGFWKIIKLIWDGKKDDNFFTNF